MISRWFWLVVAVAILGVLSGVSTAGSLPSAIPVQEPGRSGLDQGLDQAAQIGRRVGLAAVEPRVAIGLDLAVVLFQDGAHQARAAIEVVPECRGVALRRRAAPLSSQQRSCAAQEASISSMGFSADISSAGEVNGSGLAPAEAS